MKIVYLCGGRSFYSDKPGRKIAGVVERWCQMGHELLHVCGGDILFRSEEDTTTEYGAVSFHGQWYRHWPILAPIINTVSERRDIQHDAAMVRHLELSLESFKPDLIWERSCRLHCAGLVMARRLGVPYVLEWKDHLVDYRFSLFRGKALRMEQRKNQEADYIVVESSILRDQLECEGVDGGKIIVAHNAVDANEFTRDAQLRTQVRKDWGFDDETILVGYLGSYAFYHDTARLVRAAQLIRTHDTTGKIKILMVGAGKEYAESRELAEKMHLLDDILIMKPGVPKEVVPALLAALDIAVLPGSTDIICPIKVQEYMASALPSVIPDYPCNREVLRDGETGVLFKPKDEKALAEKILLLAGNRNLREDIGSRAREEAVHRFSWEATWGAALAHIITATAANPGVKLGTSNPC